MSDYTDEDILNASTALYVARSDALPAGRALTLSETVTAALDAVAPAIVARAKAEALRDIADAIDSTPWEVASSEGPLPGADDRTWLHGTDCAIRFAARLTRERADEIERAREAQS